MMAQWNLSIDTWQVYVIDIVLTGGATVQCVLGSNTYDSDGGFNIVWDGSQTEMLANAVNTAAGSLGAASVTELTVNGTFPGIIALVPDLGLLTFPSSDWDLYFATWTPTGDNEETEVAFLVPSTGVLTSTQINSLISALNSAINDITNVAGVTVTNMVLAPTLDVDALVWTAASAYDTGWEASGEGVNGFFWSVDNNGLVHWMCDLKTTATHPGTTICTIPSGYVPASAAAAFGMCESSGSVSYPLAMQTSGTVQVNVGSPGSGVRYVGSGFYPLSGV